MKRLFLFALLLIGCASPRHAQLSDPSFDAVVAAPAFHGNARLLFDDAHQNFTEMRIGMSRMDLDNKQFALNIVRWLTARDE
ncbi:MAG TPA: hypothetical protein VKB93_30035 [Thermoanaerobaculia bacterium]|nr:hypothetical protein [Thermoanaerobaculia bacterium]